MTDWADEKADDIIQEVLAPPSEWTELTNAFAQALREARAQGIEEATNLVNEIYAADPNHSGYGTAVKIRKLKEQP